jgi:hypothetical protein
VLLSPVAVAVLLEAADTMVMADTVVVDPLKITKTGDIAISHYLAFFSKKITLQQGLTKSFLPRKRR